MIGPPLAVWNATLCISQCLVHHSLSQGMQSQVAEGRYEESGRNMKINFVKKRFIITVKCFCVFRICLHKTSHHKLGERDIAYKNKM